MINDMEIDNSMLTVNEFAKKINASRSTVLKMIKEGRIIPFRLSKAKKSPYRIEASEIHRLKGFEVHKASLGDK